MSKRETPDVETTIYGIPCGIVVDFYSPPRPGMIDRRPGAGFGDAAPPDPEEIEWHLVDRRGYPAGWLEDKLNELDRSNITYWLSKRREYR